MADTTARDEAIEQGHTHLAMGELEDAESCYRRSTEFDDNFFDGWQALAMTLLKLEKVKMFEGTQMPTPEAFTIFKGKRMPKDETFIVWERRCPNLKISLFSKE